MLHLCSHAVYEGIELPTTGRRMYVDPKTYAHVDEAVQEFAMEIHPKSLRLTEEIGNGEFGNVYRGVWKTEDKEELLIAVKTLKVCPHLCYFCFASIFSSQQHNVHCTCIYMEIHIQCMFNVHVHTCSTVAAFERKTTHGSYTTPLPDKTHICIGCASCTV